MRTKRPVLSDALAAKTLPAGIVDKVSVRVLSAADAHAQCPDGARRKYSPRCFQQVQVCRVLRRPRAHLPVRLCTACLRGHAQRFLGLKMLRDVAGPDDLGAPLLPCCASPAARRPARTPRAWSARSRRLRSARRAALVSDVDEIARPHVVRQLATCMPAEGALQGVYGLSARQFKFGAHCDTGYVWEEGAAQPFAACVVRCPSTTAVARARRSEAVRGALAERVELGRQGL